MSRSLLTPRLVPGTPIVYNPAKWITSSRGVELNPLWQTEVWAETRRGVVVDESEYRYHGQPAEVPDFATPLCFEGRDYITWVRTACIDAMQSDALNPASISHPITNNGGRP